MIHLAWGLCESEVIVPYTMPITGGTKTQIFTVERDHPQATRLLFSYVAESKRIENKSSLWVCIQYSNLPKSPTSKLLLFCHAVSWTSMLTISLSCQWTVVTSNTSQLKNIKKEVKKAKKKASLQNKRTLRYNPSLMSSLSSVPQVWSQVVDKILNCLCMAHLSTLQGPILIAGPHPPTYIIRLTHHNQTAIIQQ